MKPRTGRWIGILALAIGGIMFAFGRYADSGLTWAGVLGLIIAIAGFVVYIMFWVCPSCGGFLARRALFVEYCHRCGASIDQSRFKG